MGLALDTHSIFFDSCLGEEQERSLFEFEAVTFQESHLGETLLFLLFPYGMLNHKWSRLHLTVSASTSP